MEENEIIAENTLGQAKGIVVTKEDVTQAKMNEVSLSLYLQEKYATTGKILNGLDAFDTALLSAGIITHGNPAKGIESSRMDKFFVTNPSNRLLFPEFVVRTIRETITAQPVTQYLIGETVTITGDVMRQPTLDTSKDSENRKKLKKVRVAEASQIPVTDMKLAETAVAIYKYGRGVKASYEVLRRTSIDMFRKTVEYIAKFTDEAELIEILTVIEEGDGNKNPAKVYKRSELNASGTQGVLDDTTLLKYLLKHYPMVIDTLVVGEELYLQLIATEYDSGLSSGANSFAPFTFPQGIFKGLTILYCEDIAKSEDDNERVFGVSRANGIRKTVEQGSTIQELEKRANDQTEVIYITENAGFSKIFNEGSSILEID